MTADGVTSLCNILELPGTALGAGSDDEEGGFYVVFVKNIEYAPGVVFVRPVVEGQIGDLSGRYGNIGLRRRGLGFGFDRLGFNLFGFDWFRFDWFRFDRFGLRSGGFRL